MADAGIGEAALAGAAFGGEDLLGLGIGEGAADAAGAGAGGGFLSGLGDTIGGWLGFGGADAAAGAGAGDAAAAAAPWAFDPGFAASDLAYLGGGDAAALGADAAGAGAGAFDLGGAASGGADAAAALGNSAFDSSGLFGTAGGTATPDVGAGLSSFTDTMGAGGPATTFPTTPTSAFSGPVDAFTPGGGIDLPGAGSIDPTAAAGDVTVPENASFVNGSTTNLPADNSVAVTDAQGPASVSGLTTTDTGTGAVTNAAGDTGSPAASGGNGKFLGMDIGKPSLMGTAGAALSGGLLVNNLLQNKVPGQEQVNAINSTIPQIQSTIDNVNQTAAQLRASTAPLSADAQAMMSYVSQGTLPPAMQAQVTAGAQAAKAQAASIMASHGLSADPTKNAQLKQQYDTIDSQALQLQGTLANQLYQSGIQAVGAANQTQQVAAGLQQTGLNAVGLTQNTYLALQKIYADQDKTQQAAIQNFAGALGKMTGGGGGTTIKIGS